MKTALKMQRLRRRLRETGGVVIAFSGGLDSTFLAAIAARELGKRAVAVTASSPLYPVRECRQAAASARRIGITRVVVKSNELDLPGFSGNPPDRCYRCKKGLFGVLRSVAAKRGIAHVADGTNADDLADYRPGRRAAEELGILSPLLEAGLTKKEIRGMSRAMGLPTADKPAMACLASRFPYGTRITRERLKAVGRVEDCLRRLGFGQFRARYHGDVARIEVEPQDIARLFRSGVSARIVKAAKAAGFKYVAADMEGYRTGSMNRTLPGA